MTATRSPMGAISARSTIPAIVPLLLRSVATRGRLLAMASLGAVGVLIGVLIRTSDGAEDFVPAELIGGFGLAILVPLVALVVASATLGNLVENNTLVYLWLKPTPSWHIVGAAFMTGLVIVVPLVVLPLVALAGIVGDSADVQATLVASLLGAVGYVGIFTGLGLLTQRALAWGLAYILVWEGFVASLSRGASQFALRAYTNSVLAQMTDPELIDRPFAVSTAVIVTVAVFLAAFALTSWRLSRQEIA